MAIWVEFGPVTGAGTLTFDPTWAGLVRIHTTNTGGARAFGLESTPQRYLNLGWIAVWDVDAADSVVAARGEWLSMPTWLSFEFEEFDFQEDVTIIQGATGLQYALWPGVTCIVLAYTP